MTTSPVILVDGSSYLFRAYYALPNLTNSRQEPTGAVLGVLNMLRRLIKDHAPTHMAVIFDTPTKNFRHHLFPAYKAHREAMPDALASQIPLIHQLIVALGIPLLAYEGIEADDLIGTLSARVTKEGSNVLISTGDKDMTQLISPRVTVLDTLKNVSMDERYVEEKFGVKPCQIIDFLALVGDSSDNIPGVPKVGPKTAAKWLNTYQDLKTLLTHAHEILGVVGENLRAHVPEFPMTVSLVTIRQDLDIPVGLPDLLRQAPKREALQALLERLEFRSWLKEEGLLPTKSAPQKPDAFLQECILTSSQLAIWIERLQNATCFALDTETTSLDTQKAKLVGLSVAVENFAAYLPLRHRQSELCQLPFEETLTLLKPIFENPGIGKIGQNLKYDLKVLRSAGIELSGIQFDTLLAAYVLDSGGRHSLGELSKRYLDVQALEYQEVVGKGAKQLTFDQVPVELATVYAAQDAHLAWRLQAHLSAALEKIPTLKTLFESQDMPILQVLAEMEMHGVLLDVPFLKTQSQELGKKIAELEQQVWQQVGFSFNLSSPKQLGEVLFEKLQLPVNSKTSKGQASTNEMTLLQLSSEHELPRLVLEHRHLTKLKSTYTDKLPLMIDQRTARVHTSYNQAGTSTGRLSSSEPNLQNIPIRTALGRRIRQAFIAPKNYQILAADYSQIELRIMAHLSGDERLLAAFLRDEDVHAATAREVFEILPSMSVSSEQRRKAKAINFGLIYGMSAFGLSRQLGIGRDEAERYLTVYFERYPRVLTYMETTKSFARTHGYVETVFGRRLYLPKINSRNAIERKEVERSAINAPMQGSAADIIKLAMIGLQGIFKKNHPDTFLVMQVHDELVFEVPKEKVNVLTPVIEQAMVRVDGLAVPLAVNIGVGRNWDEAH